jgi:hypothetical protein
VVLGFVAKKVLFELLYGDIAPIGVFQEKTKLKNSYVKSSFGGL